MGKLTELQIQRKNANRHTPRGLGALEQSIQQDGWIGAITVAADGETFDGSARIEVGAATGFDEAIVVESDGSRPVVVKRTDIPNTDDPRAVRLGVAANRVAQINLDWDTSILAGLAEEIDLSDLFRDEEMAELLAGVGDPDVGGDEFDGAPAVDGPTRTALGDLWSITGNGLTHRMIVGDCTDPLVVERLMGGERADAVVTDPPYGVRYRQGDEKRHWHAAKKRFVDVPIHGDDRPFDPSHLVEAAPLVVLWGANNYADKLPPSRGWLVWDKKPDITSNDFADAELAWTNRDAVVRAFRHRWSGVIRDSQNGDEHYHATEKPIALFEWCFSVCEAGDLIYDPYLGSGTAIIAAHQTGRRCFGCEIEPRWADTCLRRAEAAGLTCERIQSDA